MGWIHVANLSAFLVTTHIGLLPSLQTCSSFCIDGKCYLVCCPLCKEMCVAQKHFRKGIMMVSHNPLFGSPALLHFLVHQWVLLLSWAAGWAWRWVSIFIDPIRSPVCLCERHRVATPRTCCSSPCCVPFTPSIAYKGRFQYFKYVYQNI